MIKKSSSFGDVGLRSWVGGMGYGKRAGKEAAVLPDFIIIFIMRSTIMFILTTFVLTKLINNTNENNLQKITSLLLLVVEVLFCKG